MSSSESLKPILIRIASKDDIKSTDDLTAAKEKVKRTAGRKELVDGLAIEIVDRCKTYDSYKKVIDVLITAINWETRKSGKDPTIINGLANMVCYAVDKSNSEKPLTEYTVDLLKYVFKSNNSAKNVAMSNAFATVSSSKNTRRIGKNIAEATKKKSDSSSSGGSTKGSDGKGKKLSKGESARKKKSASSKYDKKNSKDKPEMKRGDSTLSDAESSISTNYSSSSDLPRDDSFKNRKEGEPSFVALPDKKHSSTRTDISGYTKKSDEDVEKGRGDTTTKSEAATTTSRGGIEGWADEGGWGDTSNVPFYRTRKFVIISCAIFALVLIGSLTAVGIVFGVKNSIGGSEASSGLVRSDDTSNKIKNPGFEAGVSNWIPYGDGVNLSVDTGDPHTGSKSLLVSGRTQVFHGVAQNMLGIIEPGKTYEISCWVKLKNAPSATFKLTIAKTDDDGQAFPHVLETTVTNAWSYAKGSVTIDAAGPLTQLVLFSEGPAANIDYYLDDVTVVSQ